jgi:hypothetical protein
MLLSGLVSSRHGSLQLSEASVMTRVIAVTATSVAPQAEGGNASRDLPQDCSTRHFLLLRSYIREWICQILIWLFAESVWNRKHGWRVSWHVFLRSSYIHLTITGVLYVVRSYATRETVTEMLCFLVFTIRTMDKVHKPSNCERCGPSSECFRADSYIVSWSATLCDMRSTNRQVAVAISSEIDSVGSVTSTNIYEGHYASIFRAEKRTKQEASIKQVQK